jgi:hypothetical protein
VFVRGPLIRVLLGAVLLCLLALALAGGLALRGSGLVAAGVVGLLAGCTAAGIVRERGGRSGRSVLEAAVQVTAGTVLGVLAVAGIAALLGAAVAALSVVACVLIALVVYLRRDRLRSGGPRMRGLADVAVLHRPAGAGAPGLLPPVTTLTTEALGQEWTRTTAVLAGRLDPAARQAVVLRREETLDELERRDPAGFTRWLMAGSTLGTDPAAFVRGGPVPGGTVADTDAA